MITGIHHVTAIASDAQANVDFYAGTLGLRLVKKTVNFDDPGTYHLYYGDGLGRPGTILTFFPWPGASQGRRGVGQVATTLFEVPRGSLAWWQSHLTAKGVTLWPDTTDKMVLFADGDGLALGLVEGDAPGDGGGSGTVPPEFAIRGVWAVNLWVAKGEPTAKLLTETMGFKQIGSAFEANSNEAFRHVLLTSADAEKEVKLPRGLAGAGTVHHVAFRVPDDAAQEQWLQTLAGLGYNVSPVMDRNYFHSIYYREPGGILFELATDPPGFTADESPETLGEHLKLPEQYEKYREDLEASLPKLTVPGSH